MAWSKQDRQEAIEDLRKMVKPGQKVYTTLRHVSRSGMMRIIDVHIMEDNAPHWIGYLVAKALDYPYDRDRQGVKMGGVGMDMGFALVYELSSILFKDGWQCIGEKCPSSDHSNGDRDYTPHLHKSGGYALRQAWL